MKSSVLFVLLTLAITGCASRDHKEKVAAAPAKVEKLPVETAINVITLSPEAEQRLGIKLAEITEEDVQRRRTFGGDVMIPAGKSISIGAPFAGTILPSKDAPIPTPGERISVGGKILTLVPLLTPEREVPTQVEQVQMANARATLVAALTVAQGELERGRIETEAAQIALARAEKLFSDRAGSKRAVDEARAQLNVSESVLNAAVAREQQLKQLIEELEKPGANSTATPLVLTAPQSGVIRSLFVTQGQAVTAGTILFEVVDTETMWIRVPIFVEILDQIDTSAAARIVSLSGSLNDRDNVSTSGPAKVDDSASTSEPQVSDNQQVSSRVEVLATPVTAPPSADPLNSTVDLYFECKNEGELLRPGQRVGAQLTMRGPTKGLTAPAKAIIYDIYGGTWVYVCTIAHEFRRERVLIQYLMGDRAVLAEGPSPGTQVVTEGVAELFGTEFGAGK